MSLGSAIFAFLAAGTFATIEDAQRALCPAYRVIEPQSSENAVYERLYPIYRDLYFSLGQRDSSPVSIGNVLPALRKIAADVRGKVA
jgi:L-ribulokinase